MELVNGKEFICTFQHSSGAMMNITIVANTYEEAWELANELYGPSAVWMKVVPVVAGLPVDPSVTEFTPEDVELLGAMHIAL